MDDVERLVIRLYQPGNPRDIKQVEEHLQALQRSSEGWALGDTLLQSSDPKARFFGALTFTIKIKRDWESLTEADAVSLLERLLHHLVRLVKAGEGALVVRKLCNALIAYYLQPATSWQRCVMHVMVCLSNESVISMHDSARSDLSSLDTAAKLSQPQLLALLWFAGGLAEDGRQTLAISTESHKQHKKIASNVDDVVSLLRFAMESPPNDVLGFKRAQEALKCFQSWVLYAQRAWVDRAMELSSLRNLTPLAIRALEQEDLYEEATEMLSDILSTFSAFFTAQDYDSLASALAGSDAQYMMAELKGANFDPLAMAFARLLLAYGDANVQDLARREDANLQQTLQHLMDLLRCEGYPGAEDEVCSQALDFWTTYVEFVTDSLFTVDPISKPVWVQKAQQQIENVIEACWVKIRQPPSDIALTWDSDARAGFQAFRSDVQDILQTSYTLLGLTIFEKFAWWALKSLEDRAWIQLEATLFCLNALSEAVADEDAVDEILSRLFGSSLFADMADQKNFIPAKTRQIAVSLITNYIGFFERQVEHLPAMLTFLFECVKASAMTNVAAKAIHTACSACRQKLIGELDTFIDQYQRILTSNDFDFYGKEKLIGGIAAIIQALPSDEQKVLPLTRLVQMVQRDVDSCMQFLKEPDLEQFPTYGVGALRCLVSIGKSLQAPDDIAIDLEYKAPQSPTWSSGPGKLLQEAIMNIIQKLTGLMSWNSDAMEAACQILRAGYKETQPGLFVFPTQFTIDFVNATSLSTSRLELVIDTASIMLGKQSLASRTDVDIAATYIFNHCIQLLVSLDYNASAEPEVASSIIDLADRMVPRYVLSICQNKQFSTFFSFTLACLSSSEILPNRSAAHFWATVVSRHSFSDQGAHEYIRAVVNEYGPLLCQILVERIAGEAPRSALDDLSEALKKLVSAQPSAKQWLTDALESENFPSRRVTVEQKRVWLQKILSLRGARKTNNEVKDFWILCRGPESAFAF